MSTVDDIRDRIDAVTLIGEYVPLRKAGRTYKALCPFHSERTPSFVVYPDTGSWRCFGACATGGDVFDFVMRIEHLDFRGALELLARRTGVELAPPSPEADAAKAERERLRLAMSAAVEHFQGQLMRSAQGEPARQYLRSRGFSGEDARAFRLGYAVDAWWDLGGRLREQGFATEELLAAGLARQRENGGVYDTFRGRLMIPIADSRGRAIAFGARALAPDGVPKYLNSPQSPIFDKGRVLFGLDQAAQAIRESGEAVIVEGYTDVIRAHRAGFRNVVASLGTALTGHHVATLKRLAGTIVLALDADAAGQAATVRGIDVAREAATGGAIPVPTGQGWMRYEPRLEVALKIATLPAGQDPDDVVRDSPERWASLVAGAQPVMEYLFAVLTMDLALDDPSQKSVAADRLLPIIAQMADPVARRAWVARLAGMLRIDERALAARMLQPRRNRSAPRGRDAGATDGQEAAKPDQPVRDLESWLIGVLLCDPSALDALDKNLIACGQGELSPADLADAGDRDVLRAIRDALAGPEHTSSGHATALALPAGLEGRGAALRQLAECGPGLPASARDGALWTAALRLRARQTLRSLEQLQFDLSEATAQERDDLTLRVARMTAELARVQHLLAPESGRKARTVPHSASAGRR